jgi:Bacterial alpha-L-rhamnosidase C-terminal domain
VRPHPGPVTWARGRLPTPHGPLDVSWAVGQGAAAFALTVDAPRGTSGDVSVPANGRVQVLVDGQLAWNGSNGPGVQAADGYVTA